MNVTLSGSIVNSDPLYQNQRAFTSPFYSTATAVPGAVVTGGLFGVLANGLTSPSQTNPTGLAATAPNFAALVANGTYVNTPTTVSPQTDAADRAKQYRRRRDRDRRHLRPVAAADDPAAAEAEGARRECHREHRR